MNSEATAMESPVNSEDLGDSAPAMDFDVWVDDNFALTKEGDFTSFADDVEAFGMSKIKKLMGKSLGCSLRCIFT